VVGEATPRRDFRKFDFRFAGAINLIPIDLSRSSFYILWVRFFNLIARAAGYLG